MRFEFGKSLFNGIEVGAVWRQVAETNAAGRKQPADVLDFVGGKVVEDERVALAQFRAEHLLKISREHLCIDRPLHQERRGDASMAQGCDESRALPLAVRNGAEATLADGAAAIQPGHFGVQPCFIDEHQTADIPVRLLLAPEFARGFNIGTILLGGASRFFYNSVQAVPSGATRQ
jgi:hypothetical protein